MKRLIALLTFGVLIVLAWMALRLAVRPGDVPEPVAAVDADQAAIDLTLERTRRESRTGIESPATGAPGDSQVPDPAPPRAAIPEPGVDIDPLPEGYSLGAYRGPMQRAPLTGAAGADPSPNPPWLGAAAAPDAILEQAAGSGRPFTFAVLRVRLGTDLQALDRALAALGSRIEGNTGEIVRLRVPVERGRLETIAGLDGVLGIGAVPPGLKAGAAFVQELQSRPAGGQVPVYITLMASDPAGEWRQALSELGVTVGAYDPNLRSYTANLPAAALAPVIEADFVLSVEPVPAVTANHASSVPVMGADGFRQYDAVAQIFTGLTGSGIAVGVLDTGLNTSHVDIAHGRASVCGANFIADEDWDLWLDLNGHGTHVFGTVAGAGRVQPRLAGLAPGLSHLRFGKVLSARGSGSGDDIRRGMDYLSRPTSCSWRGAPSEAVKPLIVNMSLSARSLAFSGRGVGERKLDSVVRAHSQLYVVAQANSGVHGFSNYGTAKNSLAVGAVDDAGIIARFSSHGPTADGRLAPNVVGTGVGLTSARGGASVSGHRTISGTSMAAPSVAGVAALLMQARPEFRNRPALARARLMASAVRPQAYLESRAQLPADNTGGPGAFQHQYGLGLVSARASLFSRDDPQGWIIGSATSEPDDGSYEYIDIEVPEGAARLDIVLTWDEQPADTLTRSVLNNLDLWADRGADCAEDACGEYASRSEVDNVEWLLIDNPAAGTYRVKVVPVEIYGESSTAAVAWKILHGRSMPELRLDVEDTSTSPTSPYITVDVTIDSSHNAASGATLHLSCRSQEQCSDLRRAFLPARSRVYREDGVHWSESYSTFYYDPRPISIGEVASDTPRRVQLSFARDRVPPRSVLHVSATAWNALAAAASIAIGPESADTDSAFTTPGNDAFGAPERISGVTGNTALDLALASREPGEPLVSADSRTLWYTWEAPARGLFRFRLREADSGDPVESHFVLFTGDRVVDLDVEAEKNGREISFPARAGAVYRLRLASDDWDLPPLRLEWESADTRPANDDLAYAQAIEGERGSIESSNEGATLESSEFPGGEAATVWFEWTAPRDGWWRFNLNESQLIVRVFAGTRAAELRLLSDPSPSRRAFLPAKAGETYRIAVATGSADHSGTPFELRWWPLASTPNILAENDRFADAIRVGGAGGQVDPYPNVYTYNPVYSVESAEPAATGVGTAWWQWTAPSDGRYTFRMDGSSAHRLTLFTGDALEDLDLVGSLEGGSAFVLEATGDTLYWIAIGAAPDQLGYSRNVPDAFRWGLTPANDDRTAADPVAGAAGSVDVMLMHATAAPDEPADTVGTDSVWWRWRAPASGWQRFWVEGHPLSTIIGVYPDSASTQAIAASERSFLANGRVEVIVQAGAGRGYDIRLSARPGVTRESSTTLRWAPADVPAYLAYKRAVTFDALAVNPLADGLSSPFNLALDHEGHYLFSTAYGGFMAFLRDPESGDLALAHRATAGANESSYRLEGLLRAHLWWNPRDNRLLALYGNRNFSFSLPTDGSAMLAQSEMTLDGGGPPFDFGSAPSHPGAGSPDGQYFYAWNRGDERLQVYRVDSPTQLTVTQTISPRSIAGVDALIVPGSAHATDMAVSPDGRFLYLLTQDGLVAFSRDMATGQLQPAGEIARDNTPDNPLRQMDGLRNVAIGADGSILFVSGRNADRSGALDSAVAAFDLSSDPREPNHLDTLTDLYFERDPDAASARSHLKPGWRSFYGCNRLAAHKDRPAVDVFCAVGFYVVLWNPEAKALEVTDFARVGAEDRFGNRLPYHLGASSSNRRGQAAPSQDGAHVYLTTNLLDHELSDAIHVFERASAMKPPEDAGDSMDSMVAPGTTRYEVDDALPGVPTSGRFVPALLSDGSVSAAGTETTIALDDGGYFELDDGTRYTCTAADGCMIVDGTVTAGAVTGRAAGGGDVDRFPSFRTAAAPGNRNYTVGTAIGTLTLPEASGGNGVLRYALSPNVPGLAFNAASRQLNGTPTAAGDYAMTFTATDEDGDTDTLGFNITVRAGPDESGSFGDCYVGLNVGTGQSCNYPGTADAFSVNERGRGSFLGQLAGIRIQIENETIDGRVYDFEASHQGDGVWRIDRVAGRTEPPETPPSGGGTGSQDTSPSFAADAGPGDRTYTVGTAIDTLTLPEATDGDGTLTYSLAPGIPGLSFDGASRRLSGTPTQAGTYDMTYTATDADGDSDSIQFTVAVESPPPPPGAYTPLEGLRVSPGRVQYLFFSAGGCIRINNSTINGVTYFVHSSNWQRRADANSPWEDIPGTVEPGALCAYNPTSAGEYRLVADMTIGGTRGNYSSENTIVVN